jgi:hypothetical protein
MNDKDKEIQELLEKLHKANIRATIWQSIALLGLFCTLSFAIIIILGI